MLIYEKLIQQKATLAVVGLGYVGLPLALAFAKKMQVIGFDIDIKRVNDLKENKDASGQVPEEDFLNKSIRFTNQLSELQEATFFIIAVPTLVNEYKIPDLTHLLNASNIVGGILKKGDYVVFESTVYPGCTIEDCLPVLESAAKLKEGIDFKIGYSPERINPGDKENTLSSIVKIVAGCDEEALSEISKIYQLITQAGVHKATSIKVAEAAKMVENIQRDLNISLMNELSVIFDKMKINTYEVLEAAATKWNFMKFTPGLVGGHCIGVVPYYLTYKAQQLGYHSKVITAGRIINDDMPHYVSKKIVQHIIKNTGTPAGARVLVLGIAFKENIKDVRNSKVVDMINDLLEYSLQVDIVDYNVNCTYVQQQYGLMVKPAIEQNAYDAVVLAVPHDRYKNFTEEYLLSITSNEALFADLKGIYRNKFSKLRYWSL